MFENISKKANISNNKFVNKYDISDIYKDIIKPLLSLNQFTVEELAQKMSNEFSFA